MHISKCEHFQKCLFSLYLNTYIPVHLNTHSFILGFLFLIKLQRGLNISKLDQGVLIYYWKNMTIFKYIHTHRETHRRLRHQEMLQAFAQLPWARRGTETTRRFKRLLLTKQIKEWVSKLSRRMDCDRAHVRQVLFAVWVFTTLQPFSIIREVRNLEESWWSELSTTASPPQLEDRLG